MDDPPVPKEPSECARCGESSCHCDVFPYSLYPGLYSPLPTPGFLTSVESSLRMKAGVESWRALYQSVGYSSQQLPYHPYSDQNLESASTRRKNATRESTSTLKAWLHEHLKNPYPTKGEKIMLAIITKMTLTQVSTWFANARRRLKKENKMTWSTHHRGADDSDGDDDVGKDDDVKIGELDVGSEYVAPKLRPDEPVEENLVEEKDESREPSSSRVKEPDENPKDNDVPKPKIWSLVDTATSVSPKPKPQTIAPGYIPLFPPYFSYLLPNYHSFISPYYKAQSQDLDG